MKKEELIKKMNLLFRIIGALEGTSYLFLLFFAVPMKYLAGTAFFVKLIGMPHGLLFIGYIILAFLKNRLAILMYIRVYFLLFASNYFSYFYPSFVDFLPYLFT